MPNMTLQPDNQDFESIKQMDEQGREFWFARALGKLLEYSDFRNFTNVIEKARIACEVSGNKASDHIVDVTEMIDLGKGATRPMPSFALSRYACYLIVQNADPNKAIIARGQTYFALQTRRQELADEAQFAQLKENEKRLLLRQELKEHNKQLVESAQKAGVETSLDFAIFQNHGYKGLYGGMDQKAIHQHKGLKKSEKILDHMGSTELAANLFRATQAEEKLRRDQVNNKKQANQTHYQVGQKVRQTIQELGGTMPENLPTPQNSISQIEKQHAAIETKSKDGKQSKTQGENE